MLKWLAILSTVVMLGLKVAGLTLMSWWLVFSPVIAYLSLLLLVFVGTVIFLVLMGRK